MKEWAESNIGVIFASTCFYWFKINIGFTNCVPMLLLVIFTNSSLLSPDHNLTFFVIGSVKCCCVCSAATTNEDEQEILANKIEMLVLSLKRRSQRLYRDNDRNKGRARIRRKMRDKPVTLKAAVEQYNCMVPSTETLCMETILSVDMTWPWQLKKSGKYTSMFNITIYYK